MKADLHCHSHFSDGAHPPQFLADLAISNDVTHLAITDHDHITIAKELLTKEQPFQLISGVEISCLWHEQEIHIVGLAFNPYDQPLIDALENQKALRRARAFRMADKLEGEHQSALKDYLESLPAIAYTRTHIADYLVTAGLCKNHEQAFKRYLSRRGKIFEPIQWMSLKTALTLLQRAGGVSVIAHPSRYRFTRTKLKKLLEDFSTLEGTAIETAYSNIDPATRQQLTTLADDFGLMVSSGSDFHSAANHWTNLGKFPILPTDTKNAIWNHPRWHSLNL